MAVTMSPGLKGDSSPPKGAAGEIGGSANLVVKLLPMPMRGARPALGVSGNSVSLSGSDTPGRSTTNFTP